MKKIILALIIIMSGCYKEEHIEPGLKGRTRCEPQDRKGCLCKDGTRFTSLDQSSCDNNGGFERYLCRWD